MGKKLTTFLIIFFLLLAVAGVIGVDVYLSYKTINENADQFTVSAPLFDVGADNKTIDVTTEITTPKLGFLPKSVKLNITILNGTEILNEFEKEIKFGITSELNFTLIFDDQVAEKIALGQTITLTIRIVATPVFLGITLKFIALDLDDQVINIHL